MFSQIESFVVDETRPLLFKRKCSICGHSYRFKPMWIVYLRIYMAGTLVHPEYYFCKNCCPDTLDTSKYFDSKGVFYKKGLPKNSKPFF